MGLKDLEREAKNFLRSALARLIPAPRRGQPPLDPSSVRRVLAVRVDARLGNLLMLTPSLRLLKTAFPGARVEVLLSDRYGDAYRHNPCVDEILTPWSLPWLASRRYDLAIDFSPHHFFSLSGAALTGLSGARRRVGFDRGDEARFMDDLVPVPTRQGHEKTNLAALVRHAAPNSVLPPDDAMRMEWHFGPGEREEGAREWASWGMDSQSVALFLGARAEKRLDPDWFLALGARLAAAGRKVVLVGGPAEREVLREMDVPNGVFVAPELPLRRFAAAISHACAVLSADTGPMHLAVAVRAPTVELFSHTEPWRFSYGHREGHIVLETPGRHPTLDEAWTALSSLLSKSKA